MEPFYITTGDPHQSVFLAAFTRHALILLLSYQKGDPSQTQNQCIFIRGFRAMRRLFRIEVIRAEAEPLPDDPDNQREDEIQVTRVPATSKVSNSLLMVR